MPKFLFQGTLLVCIYWLTAQLANVFEGEVQGFTYIANWWSKSITRLKILLLCTRLVPLLQFRSGNVSLHWCLTLLIALLDLLPFSSSIDHISITTLIQPYLHCYWSYQCLLIRTLVALLSIDLGTRLCLTNSCIASIAVDFLHFDSQVLFLDLYYLPDSIIFYWFCTSPFASVPNSLSPFHPFEYYFLHNTHHILLIILVLLRPLSLTLQTNFIHFFLSFL